MSAPHAPTDIAEIAEHLRDLYVERELAAIEGLDRDRFYMADLDNEISAYRNAYTGAAVTEIASLRAALGGPLVG